LLRAIKLILRFLADCCTEQSPDANALKENEPLASFLSCLQDSILQHELCCGATAVPWADVTTCPGLRNGVHTLARLYDMQHEPALRDVVTYVSPTTGDRVGLSFITP